MPKLAGQVIKRQRQTTNMAAEVGLVAVSEGQVEDPAPIPAVEIADGLGDLILDEPRFILVVPIEDPSAQEPQLRNECPRFEGLLHVAVEGQAGHTGAVAVLVVRSMAGEEALRVADCRSQQRVSSRQAAVEHRNNGRAFRG
jgi:hypothetical protein